MEIQWGYDEMMRIWQGCDGKNGDSCIDPRWPRRKPPLRQFLVRTSWILWFLLGGELPTNPKWVSSPQLEVDLPYKNPSEIVGWTNPFTIRGMILQVGLVGWEIDNNQHLSTGATGITGGWGRHELPLFVGLGRIIKTPQLFLVGGWATPLKNMKVNWDDYFGMMTFPIYGKIKNGNQTTNQFFFSSSDFRTIGWVFLNDSHLKCHIPDATHGAGILTYKTTPYLWPRYVCKYSSTMGRIWDMAFGSQSAVSV